jgi:hypothetical protein
MAKKHKGNKHETVRKTAPVVVPRVTAKTAKRVRPAKPRAARLPAAEQYSEAAMSLSTETEQPLSLEYDTLGDLEPQLIVVIEEEIETEAQSPDLTEDEVEQPVPFFAIPFQEPYRPVPRRFDAEPSSEWNMDLAYQIAEEQVALAMLEAEQAVAFCQGSDDFEPFPSLDASPHFEASHSFALEPGSMHIMAGDSEDEPFAFDHI